jgi:hypothetical protein
MRLRAELFAFESLPPSGVRFDVLTLHLLKPLTIPDATW